MYKKLINYNKLMFKCLSTTLKSADIFGQPIRLQLNGEENVRSILGGFMTFFLVSLVAVTFGIYSKDSFFKLNPQIISSTNFTDTDKIIPLNQTYLGFRISLPSQFDTTPYFIVYSNGYVISDCKNDDSNYITSPNYNGSILTNNWYCINFDNSTQDIYNFELHIDYCTNNSYCRSREEINNILGTNSVQLDYYMRSATLNPSNYNTPITKTTKVYWTTIRPNLYLVNYIYSTLHKLFTDDGLIYSNEYSNKYKENSLFLIFDDNQFEKPLSNSCVEIPRSCNYLFKLTLEAYAKIITYERKYNRISDALASVGGISNILMKVFTLFMNIYCTFIRNERIANHVYDFNFKDNDQLTNFNKNIQLNINDFQNIENDDKSSNIQISESVNNQTNKPRIFPSSKFNNRNLNKEESHVDSNSLRRMSNQLPLPEDSPSKNTNQAKPDMKLIPLHKINDHRNQKRYRFKFYDLLAYYSCCYCKKKLELKKQYETHKKVQIEIKSLLDIKRILHQTEGLDNLKMILLSNEQYALLNFISKYDLIENLNHSDIYRKFIIRKNLLKNEDNLIQIVNQVLEKLKDNINTNLDPITSKLIDYIDINLLDKNI